MAEAGRFEHEGEEAARLSRQLIGLLQAKLPIYQASRTAWPLWTYDRSAWDRAEAKWADRIAWSPAYLLNSVARWSEKQWGDASLYFQAYTFAVSAQTATVVPDVFFPGLVEPPWNEWFDSEDVLAVAEALAEALLSRQAGDVSLWSYFLEYNLSVAHGSPLPTQRGSNSADREKQLAVRLCRAAGLLPDRRGKTTGLTPTALLKLDSEARGIVEAIREQPPTEDEIQLVYRLMEADPALETTARAVELRTRLGEPDDMRYLGLWLRFPFLLLDELAESSATDEALSVEQAAYRLVNRRLAGSFLWTSYKKTLSQARRA